MEPKANIEFYNSLGKLFFAIAKADNCVKDEELKALENSLNKVWLNENAKYILKTFKQLLNSENNDSNTCFQSFVDFKRAHASLFNTSLNSKILKTANAITTSFSGQNKSELILLAKLDLELKRS